MSYMAKRVKSLVLYDRLNVPSDVSPYDLRKAFNRQALLLHPDKGHGGGTDIEYRAMYSAYDVLRHTHTRAAYDQFGVHYARHPECEAFLSARTGSAVHVSVVLSLADVCRGGTHALSIVRQRADREETVAQNIAFPAGGLTPYTVTVPHEGHRTEAQVVAGPLQVVFTLDNTTAFERFGAVDLVYRTLQVPYTVALAGGVLQCTHPSGEELWLAAPHYEQDQWYTVAGQGVTPAGTLHIRVRIHMPRTTLTQRSRILTVLNATTPPRGGLLPPSNTSVIHQLVPTHD
jgi:DnaJ-class molecular chaperone